MPKLKLTKLFMLVMLFTNITKLPEIYAGTCSSRAAILDHATVSETADVSAPAQDDDLLTKILVAKIMIESLAIDVQAKLKADIPRFHELLHLAVQVGYPDNVAWLLRNGADIYINQTLTFGLFCPYKDVTPLHLAINPNIVQLLIDNGADFTKKCKNFGIRTNHGYITHKQDMTPLQSLYFSKESNYVYISHRLKTLNDKIAIDQCIAILEAAELKARMSPEKIAWLSAVYQNTELLG